MPASFQPRTKINRRRQWWIGALTLVVIVCVATLIALCLQAGLDATVDLEPQTFYDIFFVLAIVGMAAGGLVENNGHLPTFHPLYHSGQTVCTITNTIFYIGVILVWLIYHGDERLKK